MTVVLRQGWQRQPGEVQALRLCGARRRPQKATAAPTAAGRNEPATADSPLGGQSKTQDTSHKFEVVKACQGSGATCALRLVTCDL